MKEKYGWYTEMSGYSSQNSEREEQRRAGPRGKIPSTLQIERGLGRGCSEEAVLEEKMIRQETESKTSRGKETTERIELKSKVRKKGLL